MGNQSPLMPNARFLANSFTTARGVQQRLDRFEANLSDGAGAALIGIEDAGGLLSAENVEAAFAEIVTNLKSADFATAGIIGGVLIVTQSLTNVQPEGPAVGDDLDTISGLTNGQFFVIRTPPFLFQITVKHGTGNIICPYGQDILLFTTGDAIFGVYVEGDAVILGARTSDFAGSPEGRVLQSTSGASLIGIEDADAHFATDTVEAALADLGSRVGQTLIYPSLVAAPKAGNDVVVTISVVDQNGNAVARAQRLVCEAFSTEMLLLTAGVLTMSESGTGSAVSTQGNPTLVIDTDGNGSAALTLTDATGAFVASRFLKVTPVGTGASANPGSPTVLEVSFA